MYKIVKKLILNQHVVLFQIEAPLISRRAKSGQFVMLRIREEGERIPLTLADFDPKNGTITIVSQAVGVTTSLLNRLQENDSILDLVGPLGACSDFGSVKLSAVISGGSGAAISLSQLKHLKEQGTVHSIAGFRTKEMIILEDRMKRITPHCHIVTDDGSNGHKGRVTDKLKELIEAGHTYDLVFTAGPLVMMQAVCELTRRYGIKTTVSLNANMIDGTGMCGCCRVTVGGDIKFACVDGPDFDGHLIDFEEAINRTQMFKMQEETAFKHLCRLGVSENV